MTYYPAIVYADAESIAFVCPDIPGFNAQIDGDDFDAATSEARAVLRQHLEVMADNGETIPAPSVVNSLQSALAEAREIDSDAFIVMLPAIQSSNRSVRVNLSLDERTVAAIDRAAKERGFTRSRFVAEATRGFIDG